MIVNSFINDWKYYEDLWLYYREKAIHEPEFNTLGFDIGQKGIPNSFWSKIKEDYQKALGIEFGKIIHVWGVEYFDGGYQTLHKHNDNTLNTVLFLDSQPKEKTMTTLNGLLYTMHNDNYETITPEPGKIVVFSSDVWHGVYPAKAPRRSFMVDFAI